MAASSRASARRCWRTPSTTRRRASSISGSYMDYTMPRADDVPSFKLGYKVTPCPHNPLGVKGCGEAGAIAAPAAVMNAVHDALAPLGVSHVAMPATSLNVWQAINGAARGGRVTGGSEMYDFHYHRPKSLADAVNLLKGKDEARPMSGGMTLIPTLKQRLARPSDVVDLGGIKELAGIKVEGNNVVIGGMTRHADVASSADVKGAIPALAYLAGHIGDPQVRNRGTIGGSIANNDPAADYPAAVVALNATVTTNTGKHHGRQLLQGPVRDGA